MSEGKTYSCGWERTPSGYRVWVIRRRALSAEAATFADADQRLWEVIGLATGDAESNRQYSPPAPTEEAAASGEVARLWRLGAMADCSIMNTAELFQGGLCTNCLMPIGARTDRNLQVDAIESGSQAASATLPRCPIGAGPSLSLFTDEFLALLRDEERDKFEWRPVQVKRRGKRAFHELIPRVEVVPYVGIKGRETYYGLCDTCGTRWIVPSWKKGVPGSFVSERDLPRPIPSILAIGQSSSADLAMTEDRWADLAGRPGLKGVSAAVTGIVEEHLIETNPTYTPRKAERRPEEASSWFKAS